MKNAKALWSAIAVAANLLAAQAALAADNCTGYVINTTQTT